MATEMERDLPIIPRGNEKVTELSLNSVSVKVKTDATPAALKKTKDLVLNRYEKISEHVDNGSLSQSQAHVVLIYNLAEELIKEQEKIRILKRQVLEESEKLLNRVEASLDQ